MTRHLAAYAYLFAVVPLTAVLWLHALVQIATT